MIPLSFRRIALVGLVLLQGACVLDRTPAVRACRDGRGSLVARDQSAGALRVLPSAVPGVEVDTAAWMTLAELHGPSAVASLILTARLRSDRPVDIDGLALIYRLDDGPDPSTIVDAEVREPIYTATPEELRSWTPDGPPRPRMLAAGQTHRNERVHDLDSGLRTGRSVSLAGCPTSVQLVREADLALHLGSGRAWSRRRGGAAPDAAPPAGGARVVWDTIVDGMLAGIVANASDDTLRRPVATLVLSPPLRPRTGPNQTPQPSGEPARSLEYVLDPLAPRAVAGFAGGELDYGERIVERRVRDVPNGEALPGAQPDAIPAIEDALEP